MAPDRRLGPSRRRCPPRARPGTGAGAAAGSPTGAPACPINLRPWRPRRRPRGRRARRLCRHGRREHPRYRNRRCRAHNDRRAPRRSWSRRPCRRRGEGNIRHTMRPATAAASCRSGPGRRPNVLPAPRDAGHQHPDHDGVQRQRQEQRATDATARERQLEPGRNRGAHAGGKYTDGRPGPGGRRHVTMRTVPLLRFLRGKADDLHACAPRHVHGVHHILVDADSPRP